LCDWSSDVCSSDLDAGRIKRDWLARIGIPLRDACIGNKGSLMEDFGEAVVVREFSSSQGRSGSAFALFNNQVDRGLCIRQRIDRLDDALHLTCVIAGKPFRL